MNLNDFFLGFAAFLIPFLAWEWFSASCDQRLLAARESVEALFNRVLRGKYPGMHPVQLRMCRPGRWTIATKDRTGVTSARLLWMLARCHSERSEAYVLVQFTVFFCECVTRGERNG